MASHHQPGPSGHLQVAAASNLRRTPSPSSSRASINPPATPGSPAPIDESAPDYFNPLSQAPSAQSQTSISSFPRLPSQTSLSAFPDVAPPPRRPPIDQARLPSIRLRRTSNGSLYSDNGLSSEFDPNRPRSISQPERARVSDAPVLARHSRRVPQIAMPRLTEEGARPSLAELGMDGPTSPLSPAVSLPDQTHPPRESDVDMSRLQRARKMSRMFWPGHRRQGDQKQAMRPQTAEEEEYAQELVDWLDVIDPEVQTLSTLTNVQNSLFVPDLGNWINRRPTYALSRHEPEQDWAREAILEERRREAAREAREAAAEAAQMVAEPPPMQRSSTITSRLTESHYAALPHGATLDGWSAREKAELDDHVRHMLHSRRARFKRSLKGFGQYVRRPLGFFVTLYATLITLFGLAWVLFLIGWIYVGEKQVYAIHIIDSVLVALFAIMGDGLAPFRAVDTYHMFFIARYSRMIRRAEKGKKPRTKLKKKNVPPEIRNSPEYETNGRITGYQARVLLEAEAYDPENDRQDGSMNNLDSSKENDQMVDLENAKSPNPESDMPALTYAQLKSLQHHQKKMAKSHSFYKPQETFTHHAFPLSYLIAIVILLDCHSCLQISLGACTWGIDYHTRPFALTTVILCVSITCNITAGLLISRGDRKTRKKDVWELLNRQELTEDAIKHMEEKKKKEQEKEERGSRSSDKDESSGRTSRELRRLVKLPS
ncbi:hypothetical protein CEP53_010381 [Fusarium sp. AF-6]|nr:hypothetical protein CEP53_010381 [Fusarium sp. AF-6]